MSIVSTARARTLARLVIAAAILASGSACSPGTLPGSPTPLLIGGGGGRYNGTITYRRLGGNFAITEGAQTLSLSIVLGDAGQMTGRFQSGESSGSLQGSLTGDLANGTFLATILVSTQARQAGGAAMACEGRGDVSGTLSGRNLSWTAGSITYDNCPGLTTTSQAKAVAVSPIPEVSLGRANVVITVVGGPTVRRGTCAGGNAGYPFTVEMVETSGVNVTFDLTFLIEERRNFGSASSTVLDMPFTELNGGARRTYAACSPIPGTYQAFFSGSDANGNRIRVASPLVTLGP